MATRITTPSPDEDSWTISITPRPIDAQVSLILPDGTPGDWFMGRESWATFLTRHGHPPDAWPPPLADPLQ